MPGPGPRWQEWAGHLPALCPPVCPLTHSLGPRCHSPSLGPCHSALAGTVQGRSDELAPRAEQEAEAGVSGTWQVPLG